MCTYILVLIYILIDQMEVFLFFYFFYADPEENAPAYLQLSQAVHENLLATNIKVHLFFLNHEPLTVGAASIGELTLHY